MFTLVIPLYNKEKHIERAIDSALNQIEKFQEIIVVDDGSTDRGARIIDEKYNGHVTLIRKQNGGVSSARNVGIQASSTKYICLLDADDELEPEYLLEVSKMVADFVNIRVFTVSHSICNDLGCRPRVDKNIIRVYKNPLLSYSFNYALVNSSSICMERRLFLDNPFPEDAQDGEDIFVWMSVFLSNSIVHSQSALVKIYKNSSNRSVVRDSGVPYHFKYYASRLKRAPYQVRIFLFFNILRQCYGYAAMGRREYVSNILKLLWFEKKIWYFFACPSLVVSPKVFTSIKKVLGKY